MRFGKTTLKRLVLLRHPPCQSGVKRAFAAAAVVGFAFAALPAAAQPGWAHKGPDFNINGAITLQTRGGDSVAATQNPVGAVAKANQSAATQPPTVIIQATSAAYPETLPILISNSQTPPSCPASYTRVWTMSGNGCDLNNLKSGYHNVAGSKWTLIYSFRNGDTFGWIPDGATNYVATNTNISQIPQNYGWCAANWAASLCQK
jgi:hypothetical protein